MSIQYTLYPNNLTPDPNDYRATVKPRDSLGLEELANEMIRQGSTVNKPDILAVLDDAVSACIALLLAGNRIVFGDLVQLFPSIKGVFTGAKDEFDRSRHKIDVGANPGRLVRKIIQKDAGVEKLILEPPKPILLEYFDVAAASTNDVVTVGLNGKVSGKNLRFDPAQADEGVFFVPTTGGAGTKIASVAQNDPTALIFINPAVPPGTYFAEVRTRVNDGLELRAGRLQAPLTVS